MRIGWFQEAVYIAAVTPKKTRLTGAFTKVLHIRALIGITLAGDQHGKEHVQKPKIHDPVNHISVKTDRCNSFDEDEKLRRKEVIEAFLAKLFSIFHLLKQLMLKCSLLSLPDSESIQSADEMVVSELKILSELKQCYFRNRLMIHLPELHSLWQKSRSRRVLLKPYKSWRRMLILRIS